MSALRAAILAGKYDIDIDAVSRSLYDAVTRRKAVIRATLRQRLQVGQAVVLRPGNWKPMYMHSATGTIASINAGGKVTVTLDKPIARPRGTYKTISMRAVEFIEPLPDANDTDSKEARHARTKPSA